MVERVRLKLVPAPGVIVIAPVEINDGVETEVEEISFVADRVSVEKVRSASSENTPPVPAKGTLVAVRAWRVRAPRLAEAEKRLVEEAVVLKKLVVVALVPVAFTKVKFCNVLDDVTKKSPTTCNLLPGAVVPIPMLPSTVTLSSPGSVE